MFTCWRARTATSAIATVALAAALSVVNPGQAHAITWHPKLCVGFAVCDNSGLGNAGYEKVYGQSFWGMYGGHNCTNYAAYRLSQNGVSAPYLAASGKGYADLWGPEAAANGVSEDHNPRAGDIAWFDAAAMPSDGHVAYVESVNRSARTVLVSEDNYGGDFDWRTYQISDVTEFIHFKGGPAKASAPKPATKGSPATYHAGRKVTIDRHATGGVSGHKGPSNSYSHGPTHARNTAIWIVCYVTGQSIRGPYDTTRIWDLSDDGYYYTDAWLYTGTNGPAVPKCASKTVTVDRHATGGVSGHKGPSNSYAHGPTRAKNTKVAIVCYVTGQSIKGPYGTTTIWDLSTDGYYYTDAWLYTAANGPAVRHC